MSLLHQLALFTRPTQRIDTLLMLTIQALASQIITLQLMVVWFMIPLGIA